MQTIHPFANTANSVKIVDSAKDYYIHSGNVASLDFISGLYNCPLGYSEDVIKRAMIDTMTGLPCNHIFAIVPGISQSNTYTEKLTTTLSGLIPFGKYISYTNSGAEAGDLGIRYCINKNCKRTKIVSYRNSYHGSTSLTNTVSGNLNTDLLDRIYVDFYDAESIFDKDEYIDYFKNTLITHNPESILCFMIEPMIGASGGLLMKENILPELTALCRQYGILIILDEIISGFGRLGTMFAFEKYNVIPDVLLLSKQITNGYMPMGVCILSDTFNLENTDIKMGYTSAGNPIACAAANSSIHLIQQSMYAIQQVSIQLKQAGDVLLAHNKSYRFEHAGCFAALHFSQRKDKLESFDYNIGGEIADRCYKKGLIIRGTPKSIILAPGYYMSNAQFIFATSTIKEILNEL
jgi:adenosylmethionine-8-amino-7-oxononanoate aminotransferase